MRLVSLLRFVLSHPLNRGAKAAALARVVRWQIASRLIDRPVFLPFVDDTGLLTTRGMTGATGNFYCGLHEVPEMGFVLHALRPGDLFVDIGANIGSYSVLAAGAARARVVCAEPIAATFARLLANLRANGLDQVEAHCCGLSDAPGELAFTASLDSMNRIALPHETASTVVAPVTTLDALIGDRAAAIIKIDVEGHEQSVLAGGEKTLRRSDLAALVVETNGSGAKFGRNDDALVATLRAAGFTPCVYDPYARRLAPLTHPADNTIFVRDLPAMNARCRNAPRFKLVNGEI